MRDRPIICNFALIEHLFFDFRLLKFNSDPIIADDKKTPINLSTLVGLANRLLRYPTLLTADISIRLIRLGGGGKCAWRTLFPGAKIIIVIDAKANINPNVT